MQHKYHASPKKVMFLWFAVFFIVVGGLGGFLLTFPYEFFVLGKSESKENIIFDAIIIFLSIVCGVIWKKVTFSYNDFIRLMKSNAVQFKMTQSFLFWIFRTYRLCTGILDNIYVVAKIDSPISFSLNTKVLNFRRTTFSAIQADGWMKTQANIVEERKVPDYKEKESQVIFFIPLQCPPDTDVMIESSNDIAKTVRSNATEINDMFLEILRKQSNFQGKAAFNEKGFCLTIIGGSWQGELFRKHIVSGIEISKEICKKLSEKYSARSISEKDIVWDSAEEVFRLKSGEILSLVENVSKN